MKKKIVIFICIFVLNVLFSFCFIKANEILKIQNIINIDANDNYMVYENVNDYGIHVISIYDIEKNELFDVENNFGESINDNLYFPSISKKSNYLVYTSRATNITDDNINKCLDISDNVLKYCSNIYLYDIKNKNSILIKLNNEYFDGDNYIGKISSDGNNVVFESISTNLINGDFKSINIYKYNIDTKKIILITKGNNFSGGNFNSINPSVSYDGRYVAFQSSSTNLVQEVNYNSSCIKYSSSVNETCSNVYVADTFNDSIKLITKKGNLSFNDNSGNAYINDEGDYVYYETYSNSLYLSNRSQIYSYSFNNDSTNIITKKNNTINNRDNFIQSISFSGKYIIYTTKSTNIETSNNLNNLYVYNTLSNKTSNIVKDNNVDIKMAAINEFNIFFYDDNNCLEIVKIDNDNPVIESNQTVYLVKENLKNIKNKIKITDNLSSIDNIDVYIKNLNVLLNVGNYVLEVSARDEFGNVTNEKVNFVVLEEDNEGPIFNLNKEIRILKGSNTLNLSNYLEAIDKVDGKTKIYIIDDGKINLNVEGNYKLKLMSKDNSNNVSYYEIAVCVYENYNFKYYYEIVLLLAVLFVIIFSIIKVK